MDTERIPPDDGEEAYDNSPIDLRRFYSHAVDPAEFADSVCWRFSVSIPSVTVTRREGLASPHRAAPNPRYVNPPCRREMQGPCLLLQGEQAGGREERYLEWGSNRPRRSCGSLAPSGTLAKTIDLGRTMPPEKTSFMASSTEMLVSMTSSSMMNAMFPDVGLGTVGIYTATMVLSPSAEYTCPVTKPIATIPSRGHSTKTTRLKLNCPENDVIACLVTPNTVLTTECCLGSRPSAA